MIIKHPEMTFEVELEKDPCNINLRHIYCDWLEENGFDDEAVIERRKATPEWCESHKWLVAFTSRPDPEKLVEAITSYLNYTDGYAEYTDEVEEIENQLTSTDFATNAAFWRHWQTYTGCWLTKIPPGVIDDDPFCCGDDEEENCGC